MNLRLKIPQDYKSSGSKMRTGDLKTTYYVLDAQGNAMSNYSFTTRPTDAKANKLVLQERNIYGSKRVGIEQLQLVVAEPAYVTPDSRWEDVWELPAYTPISMRDYHWSWYKNRPSVSVSTYKQEIGDKRYELANHLGNVLNVVTDRKLPVDIPLTANSPQGDGIVDYFTADVVSYSDYLPFGQVMPNRHGDDNQYRYGFQGQERDDEVKGEGNSLNYEYRMEDTRIGRFFAIDPLTSKYPWYSPYSFSGNKVIAWRELEGLEEYYSANGAFLGKIGNSTEIRIVALKNVKEATKHIQWAMMREDKGLGDSKEYKYDSKRARQLSFDQTKAKNYCYRMAKKGEEGYGTDMPLVYVGVAESDGNKEKFMVWRSGGQGRPISNTYDSYQEMLQDVNKNEEDNTSNGMKKIIYDQAGEDYVEAAIDGELQEAQDKMSGIESDGNDNAPKVPKPKLSSKTKLTSKQQNIVKVKLKEFKRNIRKKP